MKVIGDAGPEEYICIVGHTELEKFMGQFYGKMKHLKAGDNVNLGRGYDFSCEIKSAMRATSDLIEKNKAVIEAIINGITVVNSCSDNSGES